MADLFSISVSGLLAYQNALSTTGHNISNVGTQGYSRQRAEFATRVPEATGAGYLGQGVNTVGVTRMYDAFLVGQVRTYQSQTAGSTVFYDLASQVDDLLADPQAGLQPALEDFFAAAQEVSADPSSVPSRQLLISSADSLVDRFTYIEQRLDDFTLQSKRAIATTVTEINDYAADIARANQDIVQALASTGQPPNDLLDQRDLLIQELAARVGISTLEQNDGAINIFIGSGQSLVIGNTASTLTAQTDEYGVGMQVTMDVGSASFDMTSAFSDGALGGNIAFLEDVVEPARRSLGRVATGIALEFNDQHRLGIDLTDSIGGDFFGAPAPTVHTATGNTATGVPVVAISDVGELTDDDYELRYTGATWTLTNLTSGQNVALTTGSGTTADPWIADGLTLAVDGIAGAVSGDTFLIRPTASGAADLSLQITDAVRIAAAGPVTARIRTDANGLPDNIGNGRISSLGVDRVAGMSELLPLGGDITLTYDSTLQQYAITVPGGYTATPATISYDPTTDSGTTYSVAIDDGVNGIELELKLEGTPKNGDQLIIGPSVGIPGDNRNASALAALATTMTLEGDSENFQSAYARMVADVGVVTSRALVKQEADSTLFSQAVSAKDTLSGVNLDEEAANLVRFQQAYQASAQLITTAKMLFDTLLSAVR